MWIDMSFPLHLVEGAERSEGGGCFSNEFPRRDPPPRRVAVATRHAPSNKWRGEIDEVKTMATKKKSAKAKAPSDVVLIKAVLKANTAALKAKDAKAVIALSGA